MSNLVTILYPIIPHDKKKNVKIKLADRIRINQLIHVEGFSIEQVAEMYNVSYHCIQYNNDPGYRQRELDRGKITKKELYKNDPDFRKKCHEQLTEWKKNRLANDIEFVNYYTDRQRNYNSSKHGKKVRQTYGKVYEIKNRVKRNTVSRHQNRVKHDLFFKMFWNLIEPDMRTQKEKDRDRASMWRKNNPKKVKEIQVRQTKKRQKGQQKMND